MQRMGLATKRIGLGMNRRGFLQGAAAGPLAMLGSPRLAAQAERPNIIFLLTDDHKLDALGCMGNRVIRTPNLDRLSREGVTFDRHCVTTAICMTSRASIFTGLYARAHKIWDFQKPFTPEQLARTYPELLRSSGYHTGFVGKYGVGAGPTMPAGRFDFWRGVPGQGPRFPQYQGREVHVTEMFGGQAREFLDAVPRDKPFCLSLSFNVPHVDDNSPEQFRPSKATEGMYDGATFPYPRTADLRTIERMPIEVQRSEGRRRWAVRFSTPELFQTSIRKYYRLITEVDTQVGLLREKLRELGRDRNTVILFTGDHGFYLGEHGLAGKWLMHEESIRTPLIVCDPRLPAARRGARVQETTLNIDFHPTILSMAGLRAPEGTMGRDLTPLLQGQRTAWRNEFYYEHNFPNNGWIPSTEGVRTNEWKYTLYTDCQPRFEELFDLKNDPIEARNLARDGAQASRMAALRARYGAWQAALDNWREGSPWSEPS